MSNVHGLERGFRLSRRQESYDISLEDMMAFKQSHAGHDLYNPRQASLGIVSYDEARLWLAEARRLRDYPAEALLRRIVGNGRNSTKRHLELPTKGLNYRPAHSSDFLKIVLEIDDVNGDLAAERQRYSTVLEKIGCIGLPEVVIAPDIGLGHLTHHGHSSQVALDALATYIPDKIRLAAVRISPPLNAFAKQRPNPVEPKTA